MAAKKKALSRKAPAHKISKCDALEPEISLSRLRSQENFSDIARAVKRVACSTTACRSKVDKEISKRRYAISFRAMGTVPELQADLRKAVGCKR